MMDALVACLSQKRRPRNRSFAQLSRVIGIRRSLLLLEVDQCVRIGVGHSQGS